MKTMLLFVVLFFTCSFFGGILGGVFLIKSFVPVNLPNFQYFKF